MYSVPTHEGAAFVSKSGAYGINATLKRRLCLPRASDLLPLPLNRSAPPHYFKNAPTPRPKPLGHYLAITSIPPRPTPLVCHPSRKTLHPSSAKAAGASTAIKLIHPQPMLLEHCPAIKTSNPITPRLMMYPPWIKMLCLHNQGNWCIARTLKYSPTTTKAAGASPIH